MASVWDEPWRDLKLRELWAKGVSTTKIAIALRLGPKGKNAVIGRKCRLGLPSRPSPIPTRRQPLPVPPKLVELVPMAKPQPEIAAPLAIPKEQYGTGGRARPLEHYADRRPPIVGTTLAGVALRLNSYPLPEMVGGCRWIENEPQGRHTVFCDARRKAGSSYCPAHHRICWVKAPRRDNAA